MLVIVVDTTDTASTLSAVPSMFLTLSVRTTAPDADNVRLLHATTDIISTSAHHFSPRTPSPPLG